MEKCDLGLKGGIVTFVALSAVWVGLSVLINALNLAVEHQEITTVLTLGMLIVPAFCVGLVTRGWLAIVPAPVAYLTSLFVSYAMSGFQGITGDLGALGLVFVLSSRCAVMTLAFLAGRGLGRVFLVSRQEGRH